jgi:molecular chaperone GrpE
VRPDERRPAAHKDPAEGQGGQAAGPVPGSGPSSSQAAGEDPNPAPAAGTSEPRADSTAQDEGAQVEQDIDSLLADTQRERDEYLELAKRTKADFENFRKRMAADIQAASGRGKAELARELIEPVDNLERALVAAGVDPEGGGEDGKVQDPEGLAHGVLLVLRGLKETLRRHQIEAVDPKGEKFDPTLHEALSTQPVEGTDSGTVVEVVQKGYRMGDRLIRPARVVVSA